MRDDRAGRQQALQALRAGRRFDQVFQNEGLTRFRQPAFFMQCAEQSYGRVGRAEIAILHLPILSDFLLSIEHDQIADREVV